MPKEIKIKDLEAEDLDNENPLTPRDVRIQSLERKEALLGALQVPNRELRDIKGSIVFPIDVVIPDTTADASSSYGAFFVAPFPGAVISASCRYRAKTTSGTLTVKRLLDGESDVTGGVNTLSSTFDLTATEALQQTLFAGTGTTSGRLHREFQKGEALSLDTTGTLANLEHVVVTVLIKVQLRDLPE